MHDKFNEICFHQFNLIDFLENLQFSFPSWIFQLDAEAMALHTLNQLFKVSQSYLRWLAHPSPTAAEDAGWMWMGGDGMDAVNESEFNWDGKMIIINSNKNKLLGCYALSKT